MWPLIQMRAWQALSQKLSGTFNIYSTHGRNKLDSHWWNNFFINPGKKKWLCSRFYINDKTDCKFCCNKSIQLACWAEFGPVPTAGVLPLQTFHTSVLPLTALLTQLQSSPLSNPQLSKLVLSELAPGSEYDGELTESSMLEDIDADWC